MIYFLYQVELSQAELEQLIGKTQGQLADLNEEDEEAKEDDEENETMDGEDGEDEENETTSKVEKTMNDDEKLDAEYGLDDYDDGICSNLLQESDRYLINSIDFI